MSFPNASPAHEKVEVRRNRSFSGFLGGRKKERAVKKPYEDTSRTTLQHGIISEEGHDQALDSISVHTVHEPVPRQNAAPTVRLWRSSSLSRSLEKDSSALFPPPAVRVEPANMQAGPGSIQVMPPELMAKISEMQAATEALKGPRSTASSAPLAPLTPSKRGSSENDLTRAPYDKRGTFRRRMSTGKADRKVKRAESPAVQIEIVPGSFRKVSGIREERDGLGSDTLRTVEIRRASGVPLGFNFQFTAATANRGREAEVTSVDIGSVVDCQQLVRKGDRLVRVNGVDVSTLKTEEDLRLMMQVVEKLTLTLRTTASKNQGDWQNSNFRTPPPPSFNKRYSPSGPNDPYVPGNRNGGAMYGSCDPLMLNTEVRGSQEELPRSESPYEEITVFPLKDDPKKTTSNPDDDVDGLGDFPELDLGLDLTRNSFGLMEYMEGVMNMYLDKSTTDDQRREKLQETTGVTIATEPTTHSVTQEQLVRHDSHGDFPNSESETTLSSVDAMRDTPPLELEVSTPKDAQSDQPSTRVSTNDDVDDESYVDVCSEDVQTTNSDHVINGVLQMTLVDGTGFLSPGSEMRCVLSTGETYSEVRSMTSTVARDGSVDWDEQFEVDVECKRLTVSCYTTSYDRRDRLCARGSVDLSELFATGNKQRLHLTLTPRGSLQILLKLIERKRCLLRIPSDDQYFGTFGNTLQQVAGREGRDVPLIVTKVLREIDRRGLRQLGLYCTSGSFRMKQALRDSFEADCSAALVSDEDVPDVSILAALLKDYFSQLPEPLLTNDLYEDLVSAARHNASDDTRRQRLFSVLQDLPEINLSTARVLFRHFRLVLQNSISNKMNAEALSKVMGPVLLCPAPQMQFMGIHNAMNFQGQADVVEAMLDFSWPDMAYTREETTF